MTSICLSMIVKNEAHVIERCLRSVRPLITSWVIVDTGSTDGTQNAILRALEGLSGALCERPWVNFGVNRTEALQLARATGADYSLVIDADDTLEFGDDEWRFPPGLPAYAYALRIVDKASDTAWDRLQIFSNRLPWSYVGALHEYPISGSPTPIRSERLEGVTCIRGYDGARAKDPERFLKDAELLRAELRADPENRRARFYLAQSYRDAGKTQLAIDNYRLRALMGGWDEEVYFSLLQVAVLKERASRPGYHAAYERAYWARPSRAEARCYLARCHRMERRFDLAYQAALDAVAIPRPSDILFVDESVYAWRSLDELAVAAYYLGRNEESRDACLQLLGSGRLPASEISRVVQNLEFASARLAG